MRLRSPTVLIWPAFFSRAAGRSSSLAFTPSIGASTDIVLPGADSTASNRRAANASISSADRRCVDDARRAGHRLRFRLTPRRAGTCLRKRPGERLPELRLVGGKLLLDQGLHRGLEDGDVACCHASRVASAASTGKGGVNGYLQCTQRT